MSAGFGARPAGDVSAAATLAHELADADRRLAELQGLIGDQRGAAGKVRGAGLVELDIGRTLVELAQAGLALRRAQRHADLLAGHETGQTG